MEIDLEQTESISEFIIFESGSAVKEFEIQYLADNDWQTAYTGKTIENGKSISIPGITLQKVRLVLTGISAVPGIYEIIVL